MKNKTFRKIVTIITFTTLIATTTVGCAKGSVNADTNNFTEITSTTEAIEETKPELIASTEKETTTVEKENVETKDETTEEKVVEEKEETVKPSTSSKEDTKPATSEKKEETKPETSEVKPSTPVENNTPVDEIPAVHEHNWIAETIHHDAVTHQETVTTTETIHHDAVTTTETVPVFVCECGARFYDGNEKNEHKRNNGCCSDTLLWEDRTVEVSPAWDEVVTKTETVTITDKAAWDEVIYHCECGATK